MYGSVVALMMAALAPPSGQSGVSPPPKMLILPVAFTDTSGEVADQSGLHRHRLELLATELAASLAADKGQQAEVLGQAELDSICPQAASDCILALARQRRADRILVAEVFKTSTLILNLNVRVVDAATNRQVATRFISFRNDTDEAWQRTAHFVAQQIAEQAEAE
jgi:hypothetical protein